MQTLANFCIVVISLATVITFVLALFKGSLVQTWMLINTLQLVAHIPVVTTKLPANAHYFLINLLGVVRLHFDKFSAVIDNLDAKLKEFEILEDEDSHFTAAMKGSGYHVSFTRNTLFVLSAICVIALVWLMTALVEKLCCRKSSQSSSYEAKMNNFMVRFLFEVCFELVLCALINVSVSASSAPGGIVSWSLGLVTLIVAPAAIVAISSLYCKGTSQTINGEVQNQAIGQEDNSQIVMANNSLGVAVPMEATTPAKRMMHQRSESKMPFNADDSAACDAPGQLSSERYANYNSQRKGLTVNESVVDVIRAEPDQKEEEHEVKVDLPQEAEKKISSRYSTLISGMNVESKVAITQTLLTLLRRVYYAFAIVFMCQMPEVTLMTLTVSCVAMLVFTIAAKPWKDSEVQKLAIINEVLLSLIFGLSTASISLGKLSSSKIDTMGYIIVGLVMFTIAFNLFAMLDKAGSHVKLLVKQGKQERTVLK